SPMKRLVRRMRSILLTPLHAQLDGLQMLIYALHEKVDDAQSAYSLHEKLDAAQETIYSFHGKLDAAQETIYSFHEKLDDAHVKIDDTYAKLEEMYRALDDAHAETTARLNQLGELTQTINSRLEEIVMRVRTPLRVDESTFSFRTYDGFVLAPSSDESLLLTLLDAGPQGLRPGTRKILQKLLTSGMTFIDVGARLGILTLAGALTVGTSGRVFAIEPTPRAFELLNRALAINGLSDRVVTKCLAAGERRERGELYVKPASGHGSGRGVDGREPHKIIVEVIPLDDLVGAGERVDVVNVNLKG